VQATERRVIAELAIDTDGKLAEKGASPAEYRLANPIEVASGYESQGADEILFRGVGNAFEALIPLTRQVSAFTIPIAVEIEAGSPDQVQAVLDAGASRLVMQVAALRDPDYLALIARSFGAERVCVRILASGESSGWRVVAAGGAETEWDAMTWARVVEAQGAGSVIVETAAVESGAFPYDLDLLASVKAEVAIPVIACGAARSAEDLFDALMIGNADGVVLDELLHSGRATVSEVKAYLAEHGLGGSTLHS
jgi:cyclase